MGMNGTFFSKLPWQPALHSTTCSIIARTQCWLQLNHCVYWCQCTYLYNIHVSSKYTLFSTIKPKSTFLVANVFNIQPLASLGLIFYWHSPIMLPQHRHNYPLWTSTCFIAFCPSHQIPQKMHVFIYHTYSMNTCDACQDLLISD